MTQNETYRDEFLNERKEKERVLSLKDKLKRDLENAQSRISSLQEQVYSFWWSHSFKCFNVFYFEKLRYRTALWKEPISRSLQLQTFIYFPFLFIYLSLVFNT